MAILHLVMAVCAVLSVVLLLDLLFWGRRK